MLFFASSALAIIVCVNAGSYYALLVYLNSSGLFILSYSTISENGTLIPIEGRGKVCHLGHELTEIVGVLRGDFVVARFDSLGHTLIIVRVESCVVLQAAISRSFFLRCRAIVVSVKAGLSWFEIRIWLIPI